MAKILNGILGACRGKVGGVVGGGWKGINYVRAHVIPANPDTDAQQAQRGLMADCVAFAKNLCGSIFNAYYDKFVKGMSGFNLFVKTNITEFVPSPGSVDYSALVIGVGPLFLAAVSAIAASASGDTATFTFGTGIGNNGAATDSVYAFVFNETTGQFGFAVAEVDRSTGTIVVPIALATSDVVHGWAIAAKYGPTDILELVSSAQYKTAIAA